jgi:hypothetical protein
MYSCTIFFGFRLDPDLFQACKNDAKEHCHAPSWSKDSDEIPSGMIVSCLYRNSGEGGKVKWNEFCSTGNKRYINEYSMLNHEYLQITQGIIC